MSNPKCGAIGGRRIRPIDKDLPHRRGQLAPSLSQHFVLDHLGGVGHGVQREPGLVRCGVDDGVFGVALNERVVGRVAPPAVAIDLAEFRRDAFLTAALGVPQGPRAGWRDWSAVTTAAVMYFLAIASWAACRIQSPNSSARRWKRRVKVQRWGRPSGKPQAKRMGSLWAAL